MIVMLRLWVWVWEGVGAVCNHKMVRFCMVCVGGGGGL